MPGGPTSSKNGLSTPKKLLVKEVHVGDAPTAYFEHWKAPEIVESSLKYTEAFMWYLSLNMNFCKSTSPGFKTDLTVTFHPEVFTTIDTQELDYQFHAGYNYVV